MSPLIYAAAILATWAISRPRPPVARFAFGPLTEVTLMPRYAFGPLVANALVIDAKPDVTLGAVSIANRLVTVTVPAYDPANSTPPSMIHVCFVAAAPADGVSAADFLASVPAANMANATVTGPGDLAINVPGVPAGQWFVQLVAQYEI